MKHGELPFSQTQSTYMLRRTQSMTIVNNKNVLFKQNDHPTLFNLKYRAKRKYLIEICTWLLIKYSLPT